MGDGFVGSGPKSSFSIFEMICRVVNCETPEHKRLAYVLMACVAAVSFKLFS